MILDINRIHELAYNITKQGQNAQILDARPAARFNGEVPEPRKGIRSGHISGSKNLPFGELIDANGCLKSEDELAKIFEGKGIDPTKPTVNSCGSGVTACILDLALSVMGGQKSAIYDGSWTEYGQIDEPDFDKWSPPTTNKN